MITNPLIAVRTRMSRSRTARTQRTAWLEVAFCLLIFASGCGQKPGADISRNGPEGPPSAKQANSSMPVRQLEVAAAADLKIVLVDLAAAFEKENPYVHVNATFGASGSLFAQLSNRAPFDLFLSADVGYPKQLIEAGHAREETLFTYAIGELVVWVLKDSPLDVDSLGIEVLKEPSVKKIAIANPKTAPYGRAAEAAMKELGVYDQVADRLVLGENVSQAVQFVETGAADVGVVSHSLLMTPALREKGRVWIVPSSAYPPIEQGGVILKFATEPEAAGLFRSYLISERGRSILQKSGFTLLPKAH